MAATPEGPNAGPDHGPNAAPEALRLRLLDLLGPSPTDEDMLIRDLGVTAARLAPVMLDLELDGVVVRMPGGRIARAG